MGYWTKSRLIFNSFRDHAKVSIRQVARQTGLSKSSVHRLGQAMHRRNQHPESWFWETEAGRRWLIRLVVAVLYHFGLKRGVGAETMRAFFACLHLEQQVDFLPFVNPNLSFFTPFAQLAHDESGLHHSRCDDAASPSGYAGVGRQYCVRPAHAVALSPSTLHTRC